MDRDSIVKGDCDLCRSTEACVVAEPSELNCRIVICIHCQLMYAFPQIEQADLGRFYESSFANDPGSRSRPGEGIEDEDDIQKQDAFAEWGLNIIDRFMQVKDKQILDLRCQTGAFSARLRSAGAEVFCVEPFEKTDNTQASDADYPRSFLCHFPVSPSYRFPFRVPSMRSMS